MKGFFYYIILGLIQGITEPIPVSSSGHVLIFSRLLNGNKINIDIELLAIITNLGSLLAICFLYRKKIVTLFRDFFGYLKTKDVSKKDNYRYCWYLVLATIPAGIIGLVVSYFHVFDVLEKNIRFVGVTLLITAGFLFLIRNVKGSKDNKDITLKDALVIGFFQVVSLIPGISRSGATIVGGMSRDLKRDVSFDFSFLLYIPISIATTLLGIKDLITSNLSFYTWLCYLASLVVAMVTTYVATKWFKNIVRNGKLIYFVIYCLVVGLAVILFL